MFTIEVIDVTTLPAEYGARKGVGEQATLIVTGGVIHPQVANTIPQETHVFPLTSVGDEHTYNVLVRGHGYTIDRFVAIVTAYANKDVAEATRLMKELDPRNAIKR